MPKKSRPSNSHKQKAETSHTLEIRKAQLGESFYLTGQGVLRYCIEVEERVWDTYTVGHRYHPILSPAFSHLCTYASPIMFYEVVNEAGERFAYPQSLYKDWSAAPDWAEFEDCDLLSEPFGHWRCIEFNPEEHSYHCGIGPVEPEELVGCQGFAELLDSALEPFAITSMGHVIARRIGVS